MPGPESILIVVGRDQEDLYEYFRWGFGQTPGVEVVRDRRLGERRDRGHRLGPPDDRCKTDRQWAAVARAELLASRAAS